MAEYQKLYFFNIPDYLKHTYPNLHIFLDMNYLTCLYPLIVE